MKREFFNKQFAALINAYTIAQKLSDEAQDVYWEMLQDIPERIFADAIKHCLATCKFFPTISELGEASYPTKTVLGPYNTHGESLIKLDWRAQVEKMKHGEQAKIEHRPRPHMPRGWQ